MGGMSPSRVRTCQRNRFLRRDRRRAETLGCRVFRITSDGAIVETPRQYRKSEEALKKAQRRVSRRKKGRHRRRNAVKLLAKAQQQVRRQRQDFHHKTALALVRQYDVIYVEAIQPANLSRRPAPKSDENGDYLHDRAARKAGLNKSIHDAGWASFLNILACKAAWAGKRWKRSIRQIHRRTARAVGHEYRRVFPCAPTSVPPAG